jgi:hypothetical protein
MFGAEFHKPKRLLRREPHRTHWKPGQGVIMKIGCDHSLVNKVGENHFNVWEADGEVAHVEPLGRLSLF